MKSRTQGSAVLVALAALAALLLPSASSASGVWVSNGDSYTVSVIDTATNARAVPDFAVSDGPAAIAFAPGGTRAYIEQSLQNRLAVFNTAPLGATGSTVATGDGPAEIAVSSAGRGFVTNYDDDHLTTFDTATGALGPDITVPAQAGAIAITPDGSRAYVAIDDSPGSVEVVNTATNAVVDSVVVGAFPEGIAITPDGSRAYVANLGDNDVSVIDTATNDLAGPDIPVGANPRGIAITPDGSRAYVVNVTDADVSVINTATNSLAGPDIQVGDSSNEINRIAITPDGSRAYLPNIDDGDVSVINTASNTLAGPSIPVGAGPLELAIGPVPTTPAPGAGASSTPNTGKRAAALKKCKKRRGKARSKCIKRAKRLPL